MPDPSDSIDHTSFLPRTLPFSGGAGHDGALPASLAGLALAYALPFVGVLDGLLTSSAETEQARAMVFGGQKRGGGGEGVNLCAALHQRA